MPPHIAALGCAAFIIYLLWVDAKKKDVSAALWIPLAWMFIAGSRYVSLWLNPGQPVAGAAATDLDGSAFDRNLFLTLMAAALFVLHRRRTQWLQWLRHNKWIALYFLFGLLSVLWSAYPLVSFKRLVKAFGNVLMILVVLTEARPYEAATVLLRRFAFIVVPLSVLFVKYYPELGRTYNPWTREPMFTGLSMQKNGLGQLCLISGLYFCWHLVHGRDSRLRLNWRPSVRLSVVFLAMIAWLLSMADSATSLVCLAVAVPVLAISRLPAISRVPRRLIRFGLTAAILVGIAEGVFGISAAILSVLGRNPSLTTRVPMWDILLQMASHPLIGAGYESFWLNERVPQAIWPTFGALRNAHNGYLEVYLNVGLIGLALMVGGIIAGFVSVRHQLSTDSSVAFLRLSLLLTVVLYNFTEATFAAVSNIWLMLLFSIIDLPNRQEVAQQAQLSVSLRRPGALRPAPLAGFSRHRARMNERSGRRHLEFPASARPRAWDRLRRRAR